MTTSKPDFLSEDAPPPAQDATAAGEYDVLPRPRTRPRSILREVISTALLVLAIYTLANLLTARYIVDGASMAPNFATGQYIIVNRLAYLNAEPQRGDVVVFFSPEDGENLIKRVIGLPGETIRVFDQQVLVDGVALYEPYINAAPRYEGEWELGTDEFFLLGDNRNFSRDSHAFGPLPRDTIIGKALLIYWPPAAWGLIHGNTYTTAPDTMPATATGVLPVF